MPGKAEAFGMFLVLLPGLLCSYVVQLLSIRRQQTELDKVVEAVIFSFVLYLPTLPLFGYTLPVSWRETAANSGAYQISIHAGQLAVLALGSVLLGAFYAASINHDWLLTAGRKLKLTERTARKTIWNDTFHELGGWVQVGLVGDVIVTGWLRSYSDEADDSSLFLERAGWVDKEGQEHAIQGPGILITKQVGIEYIAFLDAPRTVASASTGPDTVLMEDTDVA